MRTWILCLAALGCKPPPNASVDAATAIDVAPIDAGAMTPALGASLTGITLFDGWTDPRALAGGVNTTGWEDSAFIAPGGRRLYFGYTRLNFDAVLMGQGVIDGPHRTGEHGDAFDVYESDLIGDLDTGGWITRVSTMNAPTDIPEAAQAVDRMETTMVFARFVGDADLYEVARANRDAPWGTPLELPAPVNTPCIEDNPHITADGGFLFFDSDRADPTGTSCKPNGQPRDLWVATRVGNGWSAPGLVAGAPNAQPVRFQAFATANAAELYWSGFSGDCSPAVSCIHRATRQLDGSYAGIALVANTTNPATAVDGDVISIGEVSITEDGKQLYFIYRQRVSANVSDASVGVARRP